MGRRPIPDHIPDLMPQVGFRSWDLGDGDRVTLRELQVVWLASHGLNNVEIGERMGVAYDTVRSHQITLKRNLHTRSVAQTVAVCLRRGLIQ